MAARCRGPNASVEDEVANLAMAPDRQRAYVQRLDFIWSIALSLSLYDASIPNFVRGLKNLASFLDKAEAHAKTTGEDVQSYLDTRLAPDMHPLTRQVQMASDGAKGAAARLAGIEAPAMADTETTFPELKERIAKTIAFLESVTPEQVNARSGEAIELPMPGGKLTFTPPNFLFQFAQANFMFHVTTAYALLRSKGVPLGKMDFLAGGGMPTTV